jgi:hypothetical protein
LQGGRPWPPFFDNELFLGFILPISNGRINQDYAARFELSAAVAVGA